MGRRKPDESLRLSETDVTGQLLNRSESSLFLDRYTQSDVEVWFQQSDLISRLTALGYANLEIRLSVEENVHTARVFDPEFPESLIDLRLREPMRLVPEGLVSELGSGPMALLLIDWVSLSHIRGRFPAGRKPYPAQKYPGLGLGRRLYRMLWRKARELSKDALSAYPLYFHNAVYYSRGFSYLDPAKQGEYLALLALQRRARSPNLGDFSRAIGEGRLRRDGRAAEWPAGEMYAPVSRRLSQYFAGPFYDSRAAVSRDRARFTIAPKLDR